MRVSQEILALLRVVSDGKNFYVRIQGYDDDKRFPNGIAFSTTFPTVEQAEQFRIDVAKYLAFTKKPAKLKYDAEYYDSSAYWDDYFAVVVNHCRWITDEMLGDKEVYDCIGSSLLSVYEEINFEFMFGKEYPPADYYEEVVIKNVKLMADKLRRKIKLLINSPSRHAPCFNVSLRNANTKYYECKICGYRNFDFSQQHATQGHIEFLKKYKHAKEKLKNILISF